jgi:hypothetical protein
MGRLKPTYRHRISDRIYVIYKLSNYSRTPIREIKAGLAYDRHGNYSKTFLQAEEKYNLSSRGLWTTADTHTEFCTRLYMQHFFASNADVIKEENILASNVAAMCKYHWDDSMKKLTEEFKKSENHDKRT